MPKSSLPTPNNLVTVLQIGVEGSTFQHFICLQVQKSSRYILVLSSSNYPQLSNMNVFKPALNEFYSCSIVTSFRGSFVFFWIHLSISSLLKLPRQDYQFPPPILRQTEREGLFLFSLNLFAGTYRNYRPSKSRSGEGMSCQKDWYYGVSMFPQNTTAMFLVFIFSRNQSFYSIMRGVCEARVSRRARKRMGRRNLSI